MEHIVGRRIVEIISFLVKELIDLKEPLINEEALVNLLLQQGYEPEEINMAFVLIFSLEGRIEKKHLDKEQENIEAKRMLTTVEKFKLTISAQGLLIRLTEAHLITPHELERILNLAVKEADDVDSYRLWRIVEQIVNNEKRYTMMKNHAWTVDFFLEQEKSEYLS